MSFSLDLKKLAEKAGDNADLVVRKVAIDVFSSVQEKSPVNLGRFVNNWQLGVGAVDSNISNPDDKSGAVALANAKAKLAGFKSGKSIFISNSLAYAQRLENGYSGQAPQGMARLTVIEFKRMLRNSLK